MTGETLIHAYTDSGYNTGKIICGGTARSVIVGDTPFGHASSGFLFASPVRPINYWGVVRDLGDGKVEINLAGTKREDITVQINGSDVEVLIKVDGKEDIKRWVNTDDKYDVKNTTAEYKDGLLTILIPKKKIKKIEIK